MGIDVLLVSFMAALCIVAVSSLIVYGIRLLFDSRYKSDNVVTLGFVILMLVVMTLFISAPISKLMGR